MIDIVNALIADYNNAKRNYEHIRDTKILQLPEGYYMPPMTRSMGISPATPYNISAHYNIKTYEKSVFYNYVNTFMEHRNAFITYRKSALWIKTIKTIIDTYTSIYNKDLTFDENISRLIYVLDLNPHNYIFNNRIRNETYGTFYDDIAKTNIFEKDGEGINEIIQPHNNYNNIEQQYKNFISEICKVELLWDTCDKAFNIDEFIVLYKTEIMGDDIIIEKI